MRMAAWATAVLLAHALPAFGQGSCPPAGSDRESLRLIRQQGFAVDATTRAALVETLPPCLGDPDPALRDGFAYEAYAAWMRGGLLDANALRKLRDTLYDRLRQPDEAGFAQPFAALVLAEIARTDRIGAWMSTAEREAMVAEAANYLREVRDYRGFTEGEGWRHGVAHGSDWLLQLAMNPALERRQLDAILQAIASQVAPASGHAYVFGEPERLARPLLYVARRGLLTEADWNAWFAALATGAGLPQAGKEAVGLARRHDLRAFLTAVYVGADRSDEAQVRAVKAPAAAALQRR